MNLLSIGRIFALGFVLFFLPLTGRALAQWRGYSGWDWGPGTMHWWMIGWMGPIFMVVFWVLVIVAIVYFIRPGRYQQRGVRGEEKGFDPLRKSSVKPTEWLRTI
jgi:uncharacterized membrane protein